MLAENTRRNYVAKLFIGQNSIVSAFSRHSQIDSSPRKTGPLTPSTSISPACSGPQKRAVAIYRPDCQTRRGRGAARVDRAVDGTAAAGGYRGLATYREGQEVACRLGTVSNSAVDHAGLRSSSRRDFPHALGKHPLGQRVDLQPAWQVLKIPALRPAHRARQASTVGSQGRRERRMGLSLEASPVRLYHRSRGFEAVARSQAVGKRSRICRSVLCASSFLNGCDGRHRQRDGSDGCDGARVGKYHSHLHALEREAEQGSDRASEPIVGHACGSCGRLGHKSGHSGLKQACRKCCK
jgi:hypothetical protein